MVGQTVFAQNAGLCEIRSSSTASDEDDFFTYMGFTLSPKTTGTKTVGAVTINNAEYTCAVEIGSSQELTFTITEPKTLTLYCNPDMAGKRAKINGTNTAGISADGTLAVELEAGYYSLKKGDTFRLVYISLTPQGATKLQPTAAESLVYANENHIVIKSLVNGQAVKVFNVAGQKLADEHINAATCILRSTFPAGVYFVRVGNKTSKVTVK